MLPPDAKIFDLLKPFSKDVVASIIKPIVASLRGAGGGGGGGGVSLVIRVLFSVPAVGEDPGNEAGRRENSAREEWRKGNACNDAIVYTKPTKTPLFLACVAGGFFIPFL